MMPNNYQKGSEWRKWDLQTCTNHYCNYRGPSFSPEQITKLSALTGISKEKVNSLHDTLNDNEYAKLYVEYIVNFTNLDVVAITNHNTGKGIQEIINYLESKRTGGDSRYDTVQIFPGVEIGARDKCHILIIFNLKTKNKNKFEYKDGNPTREISWDEYIEKFLDFIGVAPARFTNQGGQNKPINSTTNGTEDIIKIHGEWDFIPIFPHPNTNSGWFSELPESVKKNCLKLQIFGIVDIKGATGNTDLIQILNGKKKEFGNKIIAQINTSDAKSLTEIGSAFVWIKADPTFVGFEQIIYEPDERVRIQQNSPYEDRKKVFFEGINLDGSVHFILPDTELLLSRELVTLIGGRGSGKSALLESFAFLNEEHLKRDQNNKKKVIEFYRDNDSHLEPPPSFLLKTTLVDKDGNKQEFQKTLNNREGLELPFLYLGQEQLSGMATNDVELTRSVCDLIGINVAEFNRQDLINRAREILARIKVGWKTTADIVETFKNLGYKDGKIDKWIEEYVTKLRNQQTRLSSKETKAALEEINNKIQQGIKLKELVDESDVTIATLGKLEANEVLSSLSKKVKMIYPEIKLSLIDTKNQVGEIKLLKEKATTDMDRLRKEIIAKKAELVKQGIKEDINSLLQSSQTLQQQIGSAERNLENYRKAGFEMISATAERDTLLSSIQISLEALKDQISERFTKFQQSRNDSSVEEKELFERMISGIAIEGQVVFDEREFLKNLLDRCVDKRKVQNETELKKQIAGENQDGTPKDLIIEMVLMWAQSNLEGAKFFYRGGEEQAMEYILTEWPDFLRVRAVVRLNGKPIEVLSIGQRGTLLLKVYLSTATGRQVFIIDQPEDNLDNNFIMNELVPLILKTKRSRQIIMSTHNANLVVNSDADQVIVARLDIGKSYLSGSIENPDINKSIRDILEGGEEAFRQRERKYSMKL